MGEAIKKESAKSLAANDLFEGSKFDSKKTVKSTYTEELVIALCGPIGSPIHEVSKKLDHILKSDYNYNSKIIKLSDSISQYGEELLKKHVDPSSEFNRIKTAIDIGDELRRTHGGRFLAELAVCEIAMDRKVREAPSGKKSIIDENKNRVCYIINSIKNPEELELLQLIYGEILFTVGVFSPIEDRVSELKSRGIEERNVHLLIDTDSGEEISSGQQVSEVFPLSDFFLRIDESSASQIEEKIRRFLDLLFGTSLITPTTAETAMHAASSAAKNSACLSRQVGAAIADKTGNIIALGWNDVPKFNGGLYINIEDKNKDKRCWNYKASECHNEKEKGIVATQVVDDLINACIIEPDKKEAAKKAIQNSARLKSLIEFSRAVHAEMHAIINAGNHSNGSLIGAKLYCTTYPCHSCARHIVAAGISEVYFIEPYRKSLATKLHNDSLTENEKDSKKVRLLAFEGVAPRRYHELFVANSTGRKKDGKLLTYDKKSATPRYEKSVEALHVLEAIVTKALAQNGILNINGEGHEDTIST
ncbi:anti-phage dCTP deaminase [Chromobacterium sp. ATCC 53434]|uniref:anti-phage dCTP deaminase n=1 Tax=Chromobacterium sp. (strain ATCC 53434 / SC 14030) TaxID=2059672 RepID=UPI0018F21EA7|nr:anti-phage dCTP deaminase [Chromobacterium sp. ATCC 53434]